MSTQTLLLGFGGAFFWIGLACGVWKYAHIHASADDEAAAPIYVDIAHRAGLMYAFSVLVLERFVEASALPEPIEFGAVLVQLVFFALALSTYLIHGALRDTQNQLARPHRLGAGEVPAWAVRGFMVALIVAELGGFTVLLWGALVA